MPNVKPSPKSKSPLDGGDYRADTERVDSETSNRPIPKEIESVTSGRDSSEGDEMIMNMNGTTLTAVGNAAQAWVKGREIELLKDRIYDAMHNVTTSERVNDWGDYDPDVWAEEMQDYSSALADVDSAVLAYFIEQYKDEWGIEP